MEVVRHDLGASPSRLDGGGVDLEEFLRVDGAVVLLGQVGSELGGPIDPPQVRHERPVAGLVRADVIVGGGVNAHGQAKPPLLCSLQSSAGILASPHLVEVRSEVRGSPGAGSRSLGLRCGLPKGGVGALHLGSWRGLPHQASQLV